MPFLTTYSGIKLCGSTLPQLKLPILHRNGRTTASPISPPRKKCTDCLTRMLCPALPSRPCRQSTSLPNWSNLWMSPIRPELCFAVWFKRFSKDCISSSRVCCWSSKPAEGVRQGWRTWPVSRRSLSCGPSWKAWRIKWRKWWKKITKYRRRGSYSRGT